MQQFHQKQALSAHSGIQIQPWQVHNQSLASWQEQISSAVSGGQCQAEGISQTRHLLDLAHSTIIAQSQHTVVQDK